MADGLDIRVNLKELQKTLDALQESGKAVGLTTQHLVWELAADASKDAVKYSAPRGEDKVGGWRTQKRIGETAIAGDIEGLFADIKNPDYVFFWNDTTGKRYGRHGRTVFEIEEDHYAVTDVHGIHLKHRGRGGRVKKPHRQFWADGATVGKYMKLLQKKVGELKAGWYPGVKKFCALAHKKEGVPKWISGQMQEGTAEDTLKADGNGQVTIENKSHHREAIRPDMVAFIMKKRQKDADKWMGKRLEKIAERFNNGTAKAEAVTA